MRQMTPEETRDEVAEMLQLLPIELQIEAILAGVDSEDLQEVATRLDMEVE